MRKLSRSRTVAEKAMLAAFQVLKDAGGTLKTQEMIERISQQVVFDEWETTRYEKTGYIRWVSILHFYSIDCVKAGFLQKNKGSWILTAEGEEVMKKGASAIFEEAVKAYRVWKSQQKPDEETEDVEELEENGTETFEQKQKALLEQYEESAYEGLRNFIAKRNPYEFQDMVAALLKAMGYHVSFVAAKGKDGGIDIVAYQDALGIKTPRIKVQVKHYPNNPVGPDAVRSLKGLLNAGEEIGLFVTSGTFTAEAQRFAREANIHIRLVDGDELIELWQQHYNQLNDEDKNMLPLHPIYFLGAND